jgi:hypothetical protein
VQVWGPAHESQTNYLRFHRAKLRRLLTESGPGYGFQP